MININKSDFPNIEKWYVKNVIEELKSYEYEVKGKKISYFSLVDSWSQANLGLEFKKILILDHDEIQKKVDILFVKKPAVDYYINELKETYTKFAKASDGIGSEKINALDLVEKIITKPYTCPLCNSLKLVVRKSKDENENDYRECELDHFFSKSKFPIFALSLYNLIPSCHSCNHEKRVKELKCSPYDNKDISILTTFSCTPKDLSKNQFKLSVNFRDEMISNNIALKLEGKYEAYETELNDLVKKINNYNKKDVRKWLIEVHGDLNLGLQELFDYKSHSSQFIEKEFSKMKSDIINSSFKIEE